MMRDYRSVECMWIFVEVKFCIGLLLYIVDMGFGIIW